jgi:hypothetical protein
VPAVALHFTPPLEASFATVAVKLTVPPVSTVVALSVTLTVIGSEKIGTKAVENFVGSLTEVAVIVTDDPLGTVAGAV